MTFYIERGSMSNYKILNPNVVIGRIAKIENGQYIFSDKQYMWYLPKRFRLKDSGYEVKVGDLVKVGDYNNKKVLVEEIKDISLDKREELRIHKEVMSRVSTFAEELDRWEKIRPRKYAKKGVPLVKVS